MRGRTVKSPERVAEAQRMRAEGYSLKVIARSFQISVSAAHDWINDPEGARLRARKDSYRGACVDCGAPTGSERCAICGPKRGGLTTGGRRRALAEPRRQQIADMWNTGASIAEIADALGSSVNSIGGTLTFMRDQGWDVPLRHGGVYAERRAA